MKKFYRVMYTILWPIALLLTVLWYFATCIFLPFLAAIILGFIVAYSYIKYGNRWAEYYAPGQPYTSTFTRWYEILYALSYWPMDLLDYVLLEKRV